MPSHYPDEPDTRECDTCTEEIAQTACIGGGAAELWHCEDCGERCKACHDEDRNRA